MRTVAALAVLLACSGNLSAQSMHPNTREGFWIGFGGGSGSAGLDCSTCATDRIGAFSGYLRMGGTVSQTLLLGGEANGWFHSQSGVTEDIAYVAFVALWYPIRTGALYLKAGIGGMSYRGDDGIDTLTANAPAGSLGIGYEFRVGRKFSVVPYLNSLASSSVTLKLDGQPISSGESIKITLVQVGVGLTWH